MDTPSAGGDSRTRPRRRTSAIVAGVLVFVIGAVALFLRLSSRSDRAEALAARQAVAAGHFGAAQAPLDRWLRAEPSSAEAYLLKAEAELGLGQLREAMAAANRSRELGRPEEDVERVRALILARARRYDQAEPVLLRIWSGAHRPDTDVDQALARIYLETFRFGAAGEVISQWMRDAPADPKPYLWRTEITRRTDASPAALIRDFQAALDREPELAEARLGLAEALRKDHRFAEAASAYAEYIARKPDDPAGHLGAARAAVEEGNEASAERHIDRALVLKPDDPEALIVRAGIDLRQGKPIAALKRLDRAIEIDPHEHEPHYRRSLVLARLGRKEEARDEQETAERLRRDNARLTEIREGLIHSPNDLRLQAEAARWLIEHGHGEEGIRWAQQVLRQQADDPTMNRLMAEYYDKLNKPGLANFYKSQARKE
jgi:tetratricopeptide (TPR) repeat protein